MNVSSDPTGFPPRLAQFAMDHALDGILWFPPEGKIIYANDALGRLLGYSLAEFQARTVYDISADLTPELWRELWKEIRKNSFFAFEFTLKSKEGKSLPVEVSAHYLHQGAEEIACAFIRDIQEQKRLQRIRDEFVSTVSHELRTPTTIIREAVSQVLEGVRGDINPDQQRALTLALTGIDRLWRIINDLLDISRIEAGKVPLKRQRFDVAALAREVAQGFMTRAQERGVDIRVVAPDAPVDLYADRDRIAQVFTNLLGNALKFTPQGHIEIAVASHGDRVECRVSDSGLGIAPEDLPRIFGKFVQLNHQAVTGEKGSGLGLAICKGIVEMHDGTIAAESRQGEGSVFIVSLPRASPRDLFKNEVRRALQEALRTGATLSVAMFQLKEQGHDQRLGHFYDLLGQLVRTHSGRKTDFLAKEDDRVWLALPSTVRKEAERVLARVQEAFRKSLAAENAPALTLETALTCFPEDALGVDEFMGKVFPS